LALIRLQWWREVVEGARRRHEVAGPLGEALDAGRLDAADLLAMIDGREAEAEPSVPNLAAWRAYVLAVAGGVAVAAGRALGAEGEVLERLRALGAAYGVVGQWRSVAALARQGRCVLPEALLGAHGLTVHAVLANPSAAVMRPVWAVLAVEAAGWLGAGGGRLPRRVLAAGLPAVLARCDLGRMRRPGNSFEMARGFGDRLAVMAVALRGRV
jgi:phytoene synthase